MDKLKNLLYNISCILYPKRCFFCNEAVNVEDEACGDCLSIPEESYIIEEPHCKSCGSKEADCICKSKAMFYTDIVAPYYYVEPVTKAVRLFKFKGKTEKAETFAVQIISKLNELYPDRPFDFVCFIPQTENEKKSRGYNQAELLAQAICEKAGIEKLDALVKLYDTPCQRTLDASARSGNVLGVFDVVAPSGVDGMNLLLVDDIKTTGSTLNECAKMLKIHGANTVTAVAYAVTRKDMRQVDA